MKSIATITGLLLPSALTFAQLQSLRHDLRSETSGEAAASVLIGGAILLCVTVILGCILNIACTIIAAKRNEPNWKLSALGIPMSVVLSVLLMFTLK